MTREDVLRMYVYHPETGTFSWAHAQRVRPPGFISSGGYIRVRCGGKYHQAHRLVWLVETGLTPTGQIDHINGDRADNRFCNLRDVPPVMNSQNQRKATATSKTGLIGVSPNGDYWRAQIKVNGKSIHLGHFPTPEMGHAAYIEAKRRLHPGCTI